MVRNWRSWALVTLFGGPILAYMGFGAYWLHQKGWGFYAFTIWLTLGLAFSYLANRWTKNQRELLPPIDWDVPGTFNEFDRSAWALVEEEANRVEGTSLESLSGIDAYINTGRRLANRLAAHYHPLSTDPIEDVPLVELLTALELAAEDLSRMCRQVPGGDLVTYSHWKRAVKYSGMISRANEIYGYLLPIFQPVTGLVRLGTQKMMVQPAWKDMQQNLLRWFFRAYVNRLGTHLIELYSGRLTIGAEGYRLLTRRTHRRPSATEGPAALVISVVGARDVGKTALVEALRSGVAGDLTRVKLALERAGYEGEMAEHLREADWIEVAGYTVHPGGEKARDRATRREAVDAAVDGDLVILIVDGRRADLAPELAFLTLWEAWYIQQKAIEPPPIVAALALFDPTLRNGSTPAGEWPASVVDRVRALREALPASVVEVVPIDLATTPPTGVVDGLLPGLAPLLHRAERAAVLRQLRKISARSKARRLLSQVGRQGRAAFRTIRHRDDANSGPGAPKTR